ncbi:hypothetical protein OGAPHI_004984 [Ogataea philodendri]|uniref:Major facilitator superfamily (MFS) profile domain-containing protein n=1 Tax=Ogataea philodendri TaxID=1378263 RepID=A0A9P8P109_9ASCO|nr:uncharacterized protein OGAPHI_004984 [Ogataea philodendri]KAH3663583.1 hypothetical protein OGAPHI_004984 [Ogataea philodendri]
MDVESAVKSEESQEVFQVEDVKLDRVYWKLDLRIIPALWCLYFLSSFGTSAYGNTLTMNFQQGHSLKETLKLTSHDTSTASALEFVGFIIFDLPMNLIMTKLSPQIWLSRIIVSVGVVYACYAALKTNSGLVAIRFFSGVCSAGVWPGMSYYISLWYPEHRTARRIGYYFTAAQLSASAAGLVAAGFQKMDMTRGLEGWRWLFIVYGSITVFVGLLLIWWLPDRPQHLAQPSRSFLPASIAKFFTSPQPLNERDRSAHEQDMRHRYTKINWGWKDVITIILDIRVWPLILMYFGVVGTGFGLSVFGTTLISALNPNLSGIDVSLLYAPIWLFDLGGILLVTPFADKFKKLRSVFFCGSTVIIIIGMVVTTYAHGFWNRYAGLLIAGFGLGPTVPITMTLASEIMTPVYGDVGTAVSAALVSGLGNLGSVAATYALYSGWPADVPRLYEYSNMMLVLILGVSIVSCGVLEIIRRNKRFNRA